MITVAEIENLAALARIELSDGEKQALQKDVGAILEYVSSIKEASVGARGAPALSPALPVNVMREDGEPHESGRHTEALLRAAPKREGDYIKVKKIL